MKTLLKNIKFFTFICISSAVLVSCKSDGEEIEQPEKIYYDQAQLRMSSKNYFGASGSLEAIETLSLIHI